MTLLSLTLTLRALTPALLPRWSAALARLWLLDLLRQQDAALANFLQDSEGLKPYTVSSLQRVRGFMRDEAPQYSLRLTTLREDVTAALENMLPVLTNTALNLPDTPLLISNVAVERTTPAHLLQQYSLRAGALPRHIALRFVSPTAFHSHGLTVIFPQPALVFGSLLDRWNAFHAVKLHPDTRQFAAECVAVSRYELRSRSTDIEVDRCMNGCTGYCRYVLVRGDRYWWGLMHTLAAYAPFAGVGLHTTVGMGQTRMLGVAEGAESD